MEIRAYRPEDDPALIELEKLSARGNPPFIHCRRRFVARAELYEEQVTHVAHERGELIGCINTVVKDALVGVRAVRVAYSTDIRVAPAHRRRGTGLRLLKESVSWASARGAWGIYGLVVGGNERALSLVGPLGDRARRLLYLEFGPSALSQVPRLQPRCHFQPVDEAQIEATHGARDLYVRGAAERVKGLGFRRWKLTDEQGHSAGVSAFDVGQVFTQIPADAPYPQSEEEFQRLGHNWQLFDEVPGHRAELLGTLLQWIRHEAASHRVTKVTWAVDSEVPLPASVLEQARAKKEYVLFFKSLVEGWEPEWKAPIYFDPLDI